MLLNLTMLIVVNIVFQNQYSLLGNYIADNTIKNNNVVPAAVMCQHDTDYWKIFKNHTNPSFLLVIQSVQLFIFIPCLIGTFMVINFSGKLILKFYNNMKLMLASYDDNPP